MPRIRSVIQTPTGVAYSETDVGASVLIVGATETAELEIDDVQWKKLKDNVATKRNTFATVKKNHGKQDTIDVE